MSVDLNQGLKNGILSRVAPLVLDFQRFYQNLSKPGKLSALLFFVYIWRRFGGKVVLRGGKIINFLPQCKIFSI